MKPSPAEIIAGIRTVLADTIAPELTSDHARSRLAEIRAVLAQVDWDNVSFALEGRCLRLAEALEQAQGWAPRPLPHGPGVRDFASYQQYWEQLGALAIMTLEALTLHLDDHPEDAAVQSSRRRLLTAL